MDKEKLYFNSSPNPTIGVESELYTVSNDDLDLCSGAPSILNSFPNDIHVKEELLECIVEINTGICKNVNEVDPNIRYEDQYSNMYDNFTFSEAFKLCRQCQGNDGIFYWKHNLYLTEIKQKETNIVEKELAVSKTPPTITHEAVSSK